MSAAQNSGKDFLDSVKEAGKGSKDTKPGEKPEGPEKRTRERWQDKSSAVRSQEVGNAPRDAMNNPPPARSGSPDNTLPGEDTKPGKPDNTLPESGRPESGKPDNTLPSTPKPEPKK